MVPSGPKPDRGWFMLKSLIAAVFLTAAQPVIAGQSEHEWARPMLTALEADAAEVPVVSSDEGAAVVNEGTPLMAGREKTKIPDGAKAFLPDYMTKAAPDKLWPMDHSVVRERAQKLSKLFEEFYPNVTYHVDWDDDTVNAYAWRNWWGTRHVALKGGLLRHKDLQIEGIALVLAHEIGHHYGGKPTYSSGLSCEGQADYWAAKIGMREVYGNSYRDMMEPAMDQLYNFFSKGVEMTITPAEELERFAKDGCSHPPAACRRSTYEAAMNHEPKPACAGPEKKEPLAEARRDRHPGA